MNHYEAHTWAKSSPPLPGAQIETVLPVGKRKKYVSLRLRKTIGDNVRGLAAVRFRREGNIPQHLASLMGTSRSTVERIMAGDGIGTTIDTLDRVAAALRVQPYQLLIDKLDLQNPETILRDTLRHKEKENA